MTIKNEIKMTFEETKEEQRKILSDAKQKIYDALNEDGRFSLDKTSYGDVNTVRKYDMRLYKWIPVMINNKVCWVTLFYNNVDPGTENSHTDFGRIGFCKPLKPDEEKPFGNTGVDKKSWASPTSFGSFTPKNKKWLTVDDVLDKDFDMKALADSLVAYADK